MAINELGVLFEVLPQAKPAEVPSILVASLKKMVAIPKVTPYCVILPTNDFSKERTVACVRFDLKSNALTHAHCSNLTQHEDSLLNMRIVVVIL